MRRLVLILAAVVLARAASAAGVTVAVVRPTNSTPVMAETVVRIAGELAAAGFATEMVDASAAANGRAEGRPWAWLEQLANQRRVDAVVALLGDSTPDAVEVWVIDRVTGKSVVRRVPFEPNSARAPETLSIRAIELLRSSFLEIDLRGRMRRSPGAAPPAAIVDFVERPQARGERFAIEVGATGITSTGGVGLAVLPVLRLGWAPSAWLLVQATVAGLGTHATVTTAAGSAQVTQTYALLGAAYRMRDGDRLRPFVSLSAGALRSSVEGSADFPNRGQSAAQWSFLADAGTGVAVRLHDRFYLTVAAHAQIAEPYVAVRFVDTIVATAGRPNLLVDLAAGVWL